MSRPSPARPGKTGDTGRRSRGQTLAEFGVVLSLLMTVILGIFQVSYLIYQQYVAVNLAREGANLILRQSPFEAAASAIRTGLGAPQFDAAADRRRGGFEGTLKPPRRRSARGWATPSSTPTRGSS